MENLQVAGASRIGISSIIRDLPDTYCSSMQARRLKTSAPQRCTIDYLVVIPQMTLEHETRVCRRFRLKLAVVISDTRKGRERRAITRDLSYAGEAFT
jgi:hypothetical protein